LENIHDKVTDSFEISTEGNEDLNQYNKDYLNGLTNSHKNLLLDDDFINSPLHPQNDNDDQLA